MIALISVSFSTPSLSVTVRVCGGASWSWWTAGFGSGVVMLVAGALYTAYGGGAYPFMALLSAAGLCGVLLLRRTASGGERA